MPVTLPPLPYPLDALEPHYSKENLELHHGKHHNAYVVKLNELRPDATDDTLVQIIKTASGAVFNQAAQVWNHTFFWNSMKPKGGGRPSGALAAAIDRDLGGYDKFRAEFISQGMAQFGSGWVWLVKDGGVLKVVKTPNAETPITGSAVPLLTADVWEHAYYPTYKNLRQKFLEAFLDHLVNWDFAAANFARA
ncbi:MAG: superoxide dismutase [Planctomycetota bacterium]|nr:superoxide dismutase [Planctomycetota bacterium]MCX8039364.1 superoxide dismutase [Planctomycetota bacterium]MDW8373344.1 superoxide dismutase [Planctomycetota bacterium]